MGKIREKWGAMRIPAGVFRIVRLFWPWPPEKNVGSTSILKGLNYTKKGLDCQLLNPNRCTWPSAKPKLLLDLDQEREGGGEQIVPVIAFGYAAMAEGKSSRMPQIDRMP